MYDDYYSFLMAAKDLKASEGMTPKQYGEYLARHGKRKGKRKRKRK